MEDMVKCIRLYRFFNLDQGKYGVPFALCDAHMTAYQREKKPPAAENLILEKIADQAVWPCGDCEADVKLHLARAGAKDAGLTTEKLLLMIKNEEERERFAAAALEPHVTQKEPIWCVVLRNKRAAEDGVRLQSDAWSFRHDLSDIDLPDYEIIAKTRPVREEC